MPEEFVKLLAENYTGTAQAANLLADWLIVAGCDVSEVQDMVECHLKDMILKHFDPDPRCFPDASKYFLTYAYRKNLRK